MYYCSYIVETDMKTDQIKQSDRNYTLVYHHIENVTVCVEPVK